MSRSVRSARALVFDLDGTLVDSLDDIAHHLNAALVERGLAPRTRGEIAAVLLARWPFAVIAGERVDIPRKPDARAALSVLAELGVAPEDAVMIGDSEVDIATARTASMLSVAVAWGFRGEAALRAAAP